MNSVSGQVLIIEDDWRIAEELARKLESASLTVTSARNPTEGQEQLGKSRLDLVLLDCSISASDGLQFLTEVKASGPNRDLPVIVLSRANDPAERIRAFELGAANYHSAPFDADEVCARVLSTLRQQRRVVELKQQIQILTEKRDTAEKSLRQKSEFLANMSHEIRTPMNGVIAMTGLLLETPLATDQRSYVDTIYSSAESLLTIINDILDFSKIESGKMEFEYQPMDLRSCVEEALDLLAPKATEKGLDLTYQLEDGVPVRVFGDLTRLRQILVNLLGNAVKFTKQGEIFTSLKVITAPEEGANPHTPFQIQFSVRDTGIGIAPERLNTLFEPFVQAEAATARQFGGTGLGLSISRRLVELMGGRLWAESTPGEGSTFQFTLPFQVAPTGSPSIVDNPQAQLNQVKVLIVDDNPTNCRILALQTAKWGMKTRTALTGEQALAWLRAGETFDLAILDMQMPGMDGLMLAQEIRKLPATAQLPLVLLTSMGVLNTNPQFVQAGFATCLTKPIKPVQLCESLLRVVSGSRAVAKPAPTAGKLDPKLSQRLPLRLLVCDDNLINQKVATRVLGQMGYAPKLAANGIEALAALDAESFDLIFMDVMMPEMDGLEATREIRARQKNRAVHPNYKSPLIIVAMTASAMPGDREKCLAAGMDDYLPKPVRPEEMRAVIERWADKAALDLARNLKDSAGASAHMMSNTDKPMNDLPVVDMNRLNEFSDGNPENLTELVTLYVSQTAGQVNELQAAVKTGDAPNVRRLAHSCAGASATCGMKRIVVPLREMEQQSEEGNLKNAAQLFQQVATEFDAIQKALAPYLTPNSASKSKS